MTKRRGRGRGHGHGTKRKNKRTMRRRHSHSAHLTRNRSHRHRHRHGSRVRRGGMLRAVAEAAEAVSSANKAFKLAKFLAEQKDQHNKTLAAMSSRRQVGIANPAPTFSPAASGRLLPSGAHGVSKSPSSYSRNPIIVTNVVNPLSLTAPLSTKHYKKAAAAAARDAAYRIDE